jgi:outer membrane protein OmpA-like peptidoglycan-associated protein
MKRLLAFALIFSVAATASPSVASAGADAYDESQSNPLRIVAYLVHPVGRVLEWTVARPLHWLTSATPEQEYIFGHRPHPPMFEEDPIYDFGIGRSAKKPAPVRRGAKEPTAERVTIQPVEVEVEKVVVKEIVKIVETEKVTFPEIAFQFDSSRLTDLGKGKTYLVAQRLKEKADVVVVIEGHADVIGTEPYNERLGLRRAETIRKELVNFGIDAARLSIESLGEAKPLIDQETDWARAVNRRVEFRVAAR